MSLSIRYLASLMIALHLAVGAGLPARAQDPAMGLFAGVKALYASSQGKAETDRLDDYRGIRRLLDLIVKDYPSSDLAVSILLQDTIDGVDIAQIDAALQDDAQTARTAPAPSQAAAGPRSDATGNQTGSPERDVPAGNANASAIPPTSYPQASATLSDADPASEQALALDRRALRDIQARLTVLGHDPNGIDGVAGNGTRAALGRWQAANGLVRTGYLNSSQLELLKANSQAALDVWLQNGQNAEKYAPSPKKASSRRGLRNGWYMRNGKFCKKVQFGLQYCTPRRPPDA